MRKLSTMFVGVVLLALLLALTACGEEAHTLDFRSVLDTELNAIAI